MSHFTVSVITSERPTDAVLTKALAPFHEFECTGLDNEYVQDIDETQEMRDEYAKHEDYVFTDPDGVHHDRWQDQFKQRDTSGTFPRDKYVCPEGWVEGKVPTRKSFLEFVDDYSGRKAVPFGEEPDLEEVFL